MVFNSRVYAFDIICRILYNARVDDACSVFFSVLVAAYNIESYLRECLDSVLVSSAKLDSGIKAEVVIVDDGSTDGTGKIADEYAAACPAVCVIHQNNLGLAAVRNAGILNARGKYCVFVDGDDMLSPCALPSIYKTIEQSADDVDLVFIKHKTIDINGNVKIEMLPKFGTWGRMEFPKLQEKLIDECSASWFACTRTQFIKDNSLFFERRLLCEDAENTPHKVLMAKSIALCDEYCYLYRDDRPESIMNANNEKILHLAYIVSMLWAEFHTRVYGAQQLAIGEAKVRRIYFKVLKDIYKCKHTDYYKELLCAANSAAYVLSDSPKPFDRLYYRMARLFGVRFATSLLIFFPKETKARLVQTWLWKGVLRPVRDNMNKAVGD